MIPLAGWVFGSWFSLFQADPGAEGAQEIFSYALGLLETLNVLGYVRAIIYLLLVLFATKIIFSTLGGKS